MTPTTHHTNTHSFKAPEGVSEADCSTVAATVWADAAHNRIVTTFWQPSGEELAALLQGKPVAISFYNIGCPMHAVTVAE